MGKASRRKKERREQRALTREELLERRLRAHQCLHCGGPRRAGAVWCSKCAGAGRVRARNNPPLGYPWRQDPRIEWPTQAAMDAYLDELEAKWAAEEEGAA